MDDKGWLIRWLKHIVEDAEPGSPVTEVKPGYSFII